jgi:holin-like protein
MEFVGSVVWIVGFWALGESLGRFLHLPIPGSVLGMLLLYLCLRMGWLKVSRIESGARGLLSVLALLFVPAGAGVAAFGSASWPLIITCSALLTIIAIGVTGFVAERLVQK